MSIWFGVVVLVITMAIVSFLFPSGDKYLFWISGSVMLLVLCCRYGQGTDYFGYAIHYVAAGKGFLKTSVLFAFLYSLFYDSGVPFRFFILGFSIVLMTLTLFGIWRMNQTGRALSLAFLLPTYYLTYYASGLRQGLVIAISLGILFYLYSQKKYLNYLLGVIICSTVHMYAFILLLPLIPIHMKKKRYLIILLSGIGAVLFLVISKFAVSESGWMLYEWCREKRLFLSNILFSLRFYADSSFGLMAFILRGILFLVIDRLYLKGGEGDPTNDALYKIYFIGFCLYILLSPNGFAAHRTSGVLKVSEVILLPRLIMAAKDKIAWKRCSSVFVSNVLCISLMAICFVEAVKNLESYTGHYPEGTHFYNYPYYAIWDRGKIEDGFALYEYYKEQLKAAGDML